VPSGVNIDGQSEGRKISLSETGGGGRRGLNMGFGFYGDVSKTNTKNNLENTNRCKMLPDLDEGTMFV
jgi:hypothetical protein